VFKTGRSQAVRLPEEFRFDSDWVESFTGIPDDFERPEQGSAEKRRKL
jgi:hypothetical protein